MSNSSPSRSNDRIVQIDGLASLRGGAKYVAVPLRFVGFWLAVALPFLYLPLLRNGLREEQVTVFVGLLCLNVVALLIGHSYKH